jgi:hypothetical protein
MKRVVSVIDVRGDPADGLAVPNGLEKLRLSATEKRSARGIQCAVLFQQERWNPMRIRPMDPPRESHERATLPRAADGVDCDL